MSPSPSSGGGPIDASGAALRRQDPGPARGLDPPGTTRAFRVAKVRGSVPGAVSRGDGRSVQEEIDHRRSPRPPAWWRIDEIGNALERRRVRSRSPGMRCTASESAWRRTRHGDQEEAGSSCAAAARAAHDGPRGPRQPLSTAFETCSPRVPYPGGGGSAERVPILPRACVPSRSSLGADPHLDLGNDSRPHKAT